jgi:type II secretory pathway component PulF
VPPPLAVVFRSLAELHAVGMSWPDALRTALGRRDDRGDSAGDAWDEAIVALRGGRTPSDAFGRLVPPIDRAGLRAGEASGRMEQVLRELSARHDAIDRRRRDERQQLAYPLFIAHAAAFLSALPDLIFGRPGAALGWALCVLVPVHLFLWARRRMRRADVEGTRVGPLLERLRTKALVEEADARAMSALGWLHDAGVPPGEAIPLAAAAGRGGRAAEDLDAAAVEVAAGRPLHGAWTRLPPDVRSTLATGEQTGTLATACARVATSLEESAAHRRAMARARWQPISVLVVGLFVAIRVISFYATALSSAMSGRL